MGLGNVVSSRRFVPTNSTALGITWSDGPSLDPPPVVTKQRPLPARPGNAHDTLKFATELHSIELASPTARGISQGETRRDHD